MSVYRPSSQTLSTALAIATIMSGGCALSRNSLMQSASSSEAQLAPATTLASCRITVRFVGLDPSRGDGPVHVALWNSEQQFMKARQWLRGISVPILRAEEGGTFEGLPPGRYAISAFHDTKQTGKLRQGLFGIPKDPWAISNGGASLLPPSWARASFDITGPDTLVELDFLHRPRSES